MSESFLGGFSTKKYPVFELSVFETLTIEYIQSDQFHTENYPVVKGTFLKVG